MLPVKIWNLENADENDEFCEAMNADPGIRMKVCVDWDLDGMKAYRKAENVYYLSPDMMREFLANDRRMRLLRN